MTKLRLALTISGAVSLGAYEGGVLGALLAAVRPVCQGSDPPVRLDAIGGASAGSMAGLLASRCLVEGFDPIYVMRQAWVVQDSLKAMKGHGNQSPLSIDDLRHLAEQLLEKGDHLVEGHQEVPVEMVMSLACLRGLDYKISRRMGTGGQGIDAVTFIDFARATIKPGMSMKALLEPVDASIADVAIASGANAVGFPPKRLNRSAEAGEYEDNGVSLPPSEEPWYTDGGTLDNEPLGHTLDLTNEIDKVGDDFRRLHLLIHPNPTAAPQGNAWADPANPPSWTETLVRADHLQRTQSLYDDLRQVSKTNMRIVWLDRFVDELGPVLERLPDVDKGKVVEALQEVVTGIDDSRAAMPGHRDRPNADHPGDGIADKLRAAITQVAGVAGKKAVDIDVISPQILPEARDKGVNNVLAGEILFHFGGFADENMRESDFHLGYASALQWMSDGAWEAHGVAAADAEVMLRSAKAAFTPDPQLWDKWGTTTTGQLIERHPLALAGLVSHIGRVVVHDGLHRHSQTTK